MKQKNQILKHIIKPQVLKVYNVGEWIDSPMKQKQFRNRPK